MPAFVNKNTQTHYALYLSSLVRNYLVRHKIKLAELAAKSTLTKEFLQKIINQEINTLTREQMIALANLLGIPVNAVVLPVELTKKEIEGMVDTIYDNAPTLDNHGYQRIPPVMHQERMAIAIEKALVLKGYRTIEDCIKHNPTIPPLVLYKMLKCKISNMRADTAANLSEKLHINPLLLMGIDPPAQDMPDNVHHDNSMKIPFYASVAEMKKNVTPQSYINIEGIQKSYRKETLKALITQNNLRTTKIAVITSPKFDPHAHAVHLYQLAEGYLIEVNLFRSSANVQQIEIVDRIENMSEAHEKNIIGRLVTSITHYKSSDRK